MVSCNVVLCSPDGNAAEAGAAAIMPHAFTINFGLTATHK